MIGFTLPWALLGLLAAALPLLLHLAQQHDPPEIAFPAVRYLDDTTREHRRRLQLRHWLLLAVRTLLIMLLVLAAAGMTVRRSRVGGHPPSALALVIDNSASSSAMVDGTTQWSRLQVAAQEVLNQSTPADRLWLISADGIARSGSVTELNARVMNANFSGARIDLGEAVTRARDLIRSSGLPGTVVLVTDLQRSALGPSTGVGDVLVIHPDNVTTANRGVVQVEADAQPWGPGGGDIRVKVVSSDTLPVPATISIDGARGSHREMLLIPGVTTTIHLIPHAVGWTSVSASIPADEYRLDDSREIPIHVAPPRAVRWNAADRFLSAALEVLVADRRVVNGEGMRIGELGSGPSVVLPPNDPAQLGAMNRALAARGIPWQWGTVNDGVTLSDSSALLPARVQVSKRVTLRNTGADAEVLVTVNNEPWLVRGGNVVILGSRLDPAWTELPFAAPFVPLLDALMTRVINGAAIPPQANVGAPFTVPTRTRSIVHHGQSMVVEGGAPWRAPEIGFYQLLSGTDTLATISATVDPRESEMQVATDDDVAAVWPSAIVKSLAAGPAYAFGGSRGELRKLLLFLALLAVIAESFLAQRGARFFR